ncbi:MAG: histidinol dehydrogenase, partial [Bacteroidaceae bacterium]|nr:histidinol dehydrogenase [Bacteroidaceae bacterium]
VCKNEETARKVEAEVERQLALLPRKDIAAQALEHSKTIVVHNDDEMMEVTNRYAPEHLIIETANYMELAKKVMNAGSVFLGSLTPESAGDYASGTNHTLPTNGYAVAYSGVNLDSFCRKITFQHIQPEGIKAIGRAVELMAEVEGLDAHKNAMTLRMKSL